MRLKGERRERQYLTTNHNMEMELDLHVNIGVGNKKAKMLWEEQVDSF